MVSITANYYKALDTFQTVRDVDSEHVFMGTVNVWTGTLRIFSTPTNVEIVTRAIDYTPQTTAPEAAYRTSGHATAQLTFHSEFIDVLPRALLREEFGAVLRVLNTVTSEEETHRGTVLVTTADWTEGYVTADLEWVDLDIDPSDANYIVMDFNLYPKRSIWPPVAPAEMYNL